jgi:hypothetical protein
VETVESMIEGCILEDWVKKVGSGLGAMFDPHWSAGYSSYTLRNHPVAAHWMEGKDWLAGRIRRSVRDASSTHLRDAHTVRAMPTHHTHCVSDCLTHMHSQMHTQ